MIRAVLFDLDGTLADTALDLGGALNRLRREQGLDPLPMERLRPHVSGGARALIAQGFGIGPDDAQYEPLRQRFLDLYEAHICVDTRLFEGIPQLLAGIEAAGLAWGIVTNKAERFTRRVVARLGFEERAACVVSGDSAAHPKPHPAPLLLACQRAGVVPSETIYVGDDLRDVQAGRAAGIRTIIAAWGYLGDGPPVEQWGGDAIIGHPIDLLPLLKTSPGNARPA